MLKDLLSKARSAIGLTGQCQPLDALKDAALMNHEPTKKTQSSRAGRLVSRILGLGLLVATVALGVTACGAFQNLTAHDDDPWRRIRIEDVPTTPKSVWTTSLARETESIGKILDVGNDRILVEVWQGNTLKVTSVDILLLDLVSGETIWRTRIADEDEGAGRLGALFGDEKAGVFGVAMWRGDGASLIILSPEDGQIVEVWEPPFSAVGVLENELVTVSKPDEHDVQTVNEYLVDDLRRGAISTYSLPEDWGGGICVGEKSLFFGQIAERTSLTPCYSYGPAFAVERKTGEALLWAGSAGLGKHFYPIDDGALKVEFDPLSGVAEMFLLDREGREIARRFSEERLLGYRLIDEKLYLLTERYLTALETRTLSPLWETDVSEMAPSYISGVIDGRAMTVTADEIVWFDTQNGDQVQASKTRASAGDSYLAVFAVSQGQVLFGRSNRPAVIDEIVAYAKDGELLWTMVMRPSQQVRVLGSRLIMMDQDQGSVSYLK